MRVIPVIDLLNGQAVHAMRGERENYRPVKSVLCNSPDPLDLAGAFRDLLRLNELYVADLNAIQGFGQSVHRDLIATLARDEKLNIVLDAGLSCITDVGSWLELGIRKAVVGAETLRRLDALWQIPTQIEPDRLVFSLDMRHGAILSKCPELRAMGPMEVLEQLQSAGWKEVILLDLSRVGTADGFDRALVTAAVDRFPDLNLLAGGGIATPVQLSELKSLGVAGVLVATSLHGGIITSRHLSALRANPH